MEIGTPSIYRPYIHENSITEAEVELFSENKAKELITGGTKITKEMLEEMEFSSTTSDDSTENIEEEKGEEKKEIKSINKNIDNIIAEEFESKMKKIEDSSDDSTTSSVKETSSEIVKEEIRNEAVKTEDKATMTEEKTIIKEDEMVIKKDEEDKKEQKLSQNQEALIMEEKIKSEEEAFRKQVEDEISNEIKLSEKHEKENLLKKESEIQSTEVKSPEISQMESVEVRESQVEESQNVQIDENKENQSRSIYDIKATDSSLPEISDRSATTLDIPQEKPTNKIYKFRSFSADSLPAKALLERVKMEYNCSFLDREEERVILNDNFRKEYVKGFIKILEEEAGQVDLNEKFLESLKEIMKLLKEKYYKESEREYNNDIDVSYTVEQIMKIKKRTKIPINIDKNLFATTIRKERKEDSVSLFRFELNRIAGANSVSVIERIKRLKIRKDSEVKKMSEILFEKAISEAAFCKLYTVVVQNLCKTFRSDEERKRNESMSVFFSTIIKLCQNVFHNKEKWSKEFDMSNMSTEEKISMQETLEFENIEKESKKGRILGTTRFISLLYSNEIIGYKGISMCMNSLMELDNEQNVETLCELLKNCGEKMATSGKHSELLKVTNLLKKEWNWSNRIRFMVCDILEKCELWLKEKRKDSPFKNAFSALQDKGGVSVKEKTVSVVEEPLKASVHEKDRETILSETMDSLSKIMEDIPHVNDYIPLVEETKERTIKGDPSIILESLLLAMIEIYDSFKNHLTFLRLYLEDVKLDEKIINECIRGVYNKLEDIAVDCPYAKGNFNLTVCCIEKWYTTKINVPEYDREEMKKKYEILGFN